MTVDSLEKRQQKLLIQINDIDTYKQNVHLTSNFNCFLPTATGSGFMALEILEKLDSEAKPKQ